MIRGDSKEYDLLKKWAEQAPIFDTSKAYISCEIGVREGLGSKIIMDAFRERTKDVMPYKHIGIDPYANLKYQHYDNSPEYTCDYTDDMRKQMEKDFNSYPEFLFLPVKDTDFMNGGGFGYPYFDFVHFDGPHMSKDVMTECIWFANRSRKGTRYVFDDYPKYKMDIIADALTLYGFKTIEKGENKICLERQK